MVTNIAAADLETNLADVLDRIRAAGEQFVIEENGEAVATIGPVGRSGSVRVTVSELFERLSALDWQDDAFADDLAALQASQPKADFLVWPS